MNAPQRLMSLIKLNPEEAQELSADLRTNDSGHMRRRRWVIGLSMLAEASLGLIALYQTGIIKHLPEPDWPYMNSEKVDASPAAYQRFSVADGILGMASYAATMSLAAAGKTDRSKT